jgi:GDP-L-fucose synthase
MNSRKIVITGGTGFLGKAVRKALLNSNDTIIPLRGKGEWDLTKQKHVEYLFAHNTPDVIVHLAARVGGIGANKENPGLFMYENLAMGMNLIETARKYGALKKFVMVGTVCAYPKFTPVPFKEEDIWNGYPEETNAPYGIAKKALMEMLAAYNAQYGLNCTNLIPVNMYGPHDNFHPSISHVIPAIILKIGKAIQNKESSVELWGTGNASREFLYVDDCAEAIRLAIDTDTTPEPINIGTGAEFKISVLAEKIASIMGYEGDVLFNANGLDGQPRRCLDTSRAYETLGFQARTGLARGLSNTVSWYNNNKEQFVDYFDHIQ